jgi:hypothetical protein
MFMVNLDLLASALSEHDAKDYAFHFTIKERQQYIELENGTRLLNGESAFGASEAWPAQLENLGYFIARETREGNISVNEQTFTNDNLVSLLKKYKPRLFTRSYVSEKEVENTISKVVEFIERGIVKGTIENKLYEEFYALPTYKQKLFRLVKPLGRKFMDSLCEQEGIKEKVKLLENNNYQNLIVVRYGCLYH